MKKTSKEINKNEAERTKKIGEETNETKDKTETNRKRKENRKDYSERAN